MTQPWRAATSSRPGRHRLAAVLCAALAMAVTTASTTPARAQPRRADDRAAWTVLVYDDADTENIEGDVLRDIELDDARPQNITAMLDIADTMIEERAGDLETLTGLLAAPRSPALAAVGRA
jgi:hypothetical protein